LPALQTRGLAANSLHDLVRTLREQKGVRDMVPQVGTAISLLHVIPVTSATAERSFSALKLIKTPLRSTMSSKLLNALAVFDIHKLHLDPKIVPKAEDKGTDLRTRKYLLSVAANRINGMTEVAATQAAVSLLGMPAQEGSAKTAFIHVASAIADVRSRELEWAGQNPACAWNEEIIRGEHLEVRSATPDANGEEEDAEFDTLDHHWDMEVPSLSMASEPQSETLFEDLMDDTGVHHRPVLEDAQHEVHHHPEGGVPPRDEHQHDPSD